MLFKIQQVSLYQGVNLFYYFILDLPSLITVIIGKECFYETQEFSLSGISNYVVIEYRSSIFSSTEYS